MGIILYIDYRIGISSGMYYRYPTELHFVKTLFGLALGVLFGYRFGKERNRNLKRLIFPTLLLGLALLSPWINVEVIVLSDLRICIIKETTAMAIISGYFYERL